jgi:hypothetical protein
MAVDDCIRVTCRFKNTVSGDIVNVFHFKQYSATPTDDSDIADDLTYIIDGLYSGIAGSLNAANDPYDIRFDVVEWSAGKETLVRNIRTDSWVLTTPPTGSGDQLPTQDAAIVNLRTTIPKVFGRKYLGALGEGQVTNGNLISSPLAAFATFADGLLGYLNHGLNSYLAGVLSYKAGAGAGFFTQFVGYVVNAITGTQRRRRTNRGS